MQTHDLIGIGFGPSNIALAIALEEARHPLRPLFIEKQAGFAWHRNMLLDNAHMQISFLKDLVTLRNPSSRYTFISYLHEKQRLQDFINLKTFFPSRHEFNDYLAWAASHFDDRCAYGEEVVEILPEMRGNEVVLLRLRSQDAEQRVHERLARNLVISIGGKPNIPESFRSLKGNPRVFHSSNYLEEIAKWSDAKRIAIVGAGQSAAEIFMDLTGRPGQRSVDLIMRARAIKPSDDSPFVNEIFNADFTDFVFNRPDAERAALLHEFSQTNYAAPDLALIEQIYDLLYRQKVSGEERHHFLRRHEVAAAQAVSDGIRLDLRDLNEGCEFSAGYDVVILATGYMRDFHKRLLQPLSEYLGEFEVDRDYRLRSDDRMHPAIFLQGACESSHGLSDTLLSVTATRTAEIGRALSASAKPLSLRNEERPRQAVAS